MKTIKIDRDVYNYLMSKAASAGESPSLILRRELHLPQPTETIEVDDDTYNYLVSKTANFGESASDILRRELNLDEEPHDGPTGAIVFHIPAGTGAQPWNTRESAIAATVGDTLRIVNDDSVAHRLHTNGNPFPHPSSDIPPGQAADFVLQTQFDSSATSQPLYDHNAGPNAQFWINVRPLS
jgi:negative regulator of replication initiation